MIYSSEVQHWWLKKERFECSLAYKDLQTCFNTILLLSSDKTKVIKIILWYILDIYFWYFSWFVLNLFALIYFDYKLLLLKTLCDLLLHLKTSHWDLSGFNLIASELIWLSTYTISSDNTIKQQHFRRLANATLDQKALPQTSGHSTTGQATLLCRRTLR